MGGHRRSIRAGGWEEAFITRDKMGDKSTAFDVGFHSAGVMREVISVQLSVYVRIPLGRVCDEELAALFRTIVDGEKSESKIHVTRA